MSHTHGTHVSRDIGVLFGTGPLGELSDRQLLELFTARGDAAEPAFATLVRRHGPMVLGVCRGMLRDHHDAEDAFQTTFLLLARKARGLWVRDSLGPWLHAVACRSARCARSAAARRTLHEHAAGEAAPTSAADSGQDDAGAVVQEEIARLPNRFRAAVVLCDLEELTQDEAARRLGWPPGTVRSRLARGRHRLKARSIRRGLGPAVVAALGLEAAVPPALTASVLGAGTVAPSTRVAELAGKVVRNMIVDQVKIALAAALALVAFVPGLAVLVGRAPGAQVGDVPAGKPAPPRPDQPAVVEPVAPKPPDDAARADARVRVLIRLRDEFYRKYLNGETSLDQYFTWQRRFRDAALERVDTAKGLLDFAEKDLSGLSTVEAKVKMLVERGEAPNSDAMICEYYRMEAEEFLARAKKRLDEAERKGADKPKAPSAKTPARPGE